MRYAGFLFVLIGVGLGCHSVYLVAALFDLVPELIEYVVGIFAFSLGMALLKD